MASTKDNAKRAERALEWFCEAQYHIRAARRISGQRDLNRLTIFHLQQALEMSVKGLARASGYAHETVKGQFGHDYVDLYVSLLEKVLEGTNLLGMVNELLSVFYVEGASYDASTHLSSVRNHLASPRSVRAKLTDADWRTIFLSAFRMKPDEVDQLVKEYDSISRDRAIEYGGLVLLREQMALERDIASKVLSPSEVNKEFERRFPFLRPLLGLFIFGCIFWPHNMPARYPAPSGTDPDVFQVGQFGSMGVCHYSTNLGVVKRLKVLLKCCEEVIEALMDAYRRGYLFMTPIDVETDE